MQAARALEGYEECLLQCIAIASSLYANAQDDDAEEVQPPSAPLFESKRLPRQTVLLEAIPRMSLLRS